jgi:hypothetical protein
MPQISDKQQNMMREAEEKGLNPKCLFCENHECYDLRWNERMKAPYKIWLFHKDRFICKTCHNRMVSYGFLFNPFVEAMTYARAWIGKICH